MLSQKIFNLIIKQHVISTYERFGFLYAKTRNFSSEKPKMTAEPNKQIVAVSQMRSTSDKIENFKQVCKIAEKAAERSAKFLFLPECCDFVGENRDQTLELAETLDGQTVSSYRDLAQKHNLWISCGGVHESILSVDGKKTDMIHNAHVIINDLGEIVTVYRKLHMFDVDTPQFRFQESNVVSKGSDIIAPIETPIGNVGLQICYDVRFPEVSTILRKNGAEILTYPSAFAYSTGKAHWEVLLRARAIENQCYVIAAAQTGFHNQKRQSYGHAMIVDPWGKVIADCKDNDLDVSTVEIDVNSINKVRTSMPCFQHRRDDIYSLTAIELANKTRSLENLRFANHDISYETIFYESQFCFAFTNIRCVVPGHVLIATKRIVRRLKDLTGDEISDLFQCVVKVQKLLENVYNTTSATVTVQDGKDAGQTVEHVHFHVMPRRKGDFEHNDLIYVELNKLEKSTENLDRDIKERIEEAQLYRNYFEK